ncbi:hypothetical protein ABZ814_21380 [Micromonospora musae]|uniref:hypothetical protein n=1 Tax=Micromonospora musae TaxID=1894970 RepID=UPI0034010EAF
MVFRTWRNLLLTALGLGVLAGAGQLGIAFGLGIVQLTGASADTTVNQWPAQLVWVGWFAAHAAVAGTVVTARLARRYGEPASTGRLVAIAAAAALGATVVAPLCVRPVQAAERFSVDPIWAVGICAILGALVGAGAAIAALVKPPLGWNMAAAGGVVWLLALVPVVPALATAGALPAVRLGVLEPVGVGAEAAQRQAILILPLVALLLGAVTSGVARRRGHPPLVNGATGAAGPVLVAFAYLTAGPGVAADRYQIAPYYSALLAVAAGVLGSAVVASFRRPLLRRAADEQVVESTDLLRPLSADPAVPPALTPALGRTADELGPAALAGRSPVTGAMAVGPRAAEPLGFGAPDGDRDDSFAPDDYPTWIATPAAPGALAAPAVPADLAPSADLDDTSEASEPFPAAVAHLPTEPGGSGSGTAEADDTEPGGPLVAPGNRRMFQPPKTDRTWTQPTWPLVPARRVPAPTEPVPGAEAAHPADPRESPESALPPRHRPPLPNLNEAGEWDALATARRAGPPSTSPAAPTSVAEAGRAGGRRGLFRRNKSQADVGAGTPANGEPLPRQDAEFVDWVSQLGKPGADRNEPDESGHRSRR